MEVWRQHELDCHMSVNYFTNLEAECHFPKLGCSESSFPKKRGVSVIYPNKNEFMTISYCIDYRINWNK